MPPLLADSRSTSGDAATHAAEPRAISAADLDLLADLLAERLAPRVAELLRPQPAGELVDAATLADLLGVARSYVYEHANELGARRLGAGRRARLRFDLATARDALGQIDAPPAAKPTPRHPRSRRPNVGTILRVRG